MQEMTKEASESVWRPKPGSLVQIWDYTDKHPEFANRIAGHGQVGYVVKQSGGTDSYDPQSTGPVFEVIVFGDAEPIRHHVNHCWLREIKKSSDIKKVVDTE